MLTSISIANLGLIQKTQIQFDAGFTVITGETGAGKSFFCRAIELSLGSRAKEKSYSGDSKTIIETVFGEHIFRRVLENGKSRFFIDDCPRSLSEGQAFSLQHFDMHSQHENAFLRKPNSASVLLDASLSNSKWKKDFLLAYGEYKKKEKKLLETNALIEQQKLQQEFLAFQKQKMESVSFTLEEVEEAEKEVQSSEKFLDQKEYIESSINLLLLLIL